MLQLLFAFVGGLIRRVVALVMQCEPCRTIISSGFLIVALIAGALGFVEIIKRIQKRNQDRTGENGGDS